MQSVALSYDAAKASVDNLPSNHTPPPPVFILCFEEDVCDGMHQSFVPGKLSRRRGCRKGQGEREKSPLKPVTVCP